MAEGGGRPRFPTILGGTQAIGGGVKAAHPELSPSRRIDGPTDPGDDRN